MESFKFIKEDDKFFSRLLSKESSMANPSLRVYYGVATGNVPFMWESQPGTPKHASAGTVLPPLTPPPSYCYTATKKKCKKIKSSKSNLIAAILHNLSLLRKLTVITTTSPLKNSYPLSSSSYSSSTSSNFSSVDGMHRRTQSSPRTPSSMAYDSDSEQERLPTSTLCFGLRQWHSVGGEAKSSPMAVVRHGSS